MSEVIVFPDAVQHAITYLRTQFTAFGDSAIVDNTVPTPRPPRLVRVNRVGGFRIDMARETVQLSVDCWDVRTDLASDLAALAHGLLWAMPDRYVGVTTYHPSDTVGVHDDPDPDTASPRWAFTLQLDFRGTALVEV